MEIPLRTFVDFATSRVDRMAIAKAYKVYDGTTISEFYGPLRAMLNAGHGEFGPNAEEKIAALTDGRKRRLYPPLVDAYREWWGAESRVWFAAEPQIVPVSDWDVRVDPIIVCMGARKCAIELNWSGVPLSQWGVDLTCTLLSAAVKRYGYHAAVLDVATGSLRTLSRLPSEEAHLRLLLRGEAAALSTVYAGLG